MTLLHIFMSTDSLQYTYLHKIRVSLRSKCQILYLIWSTIGLPFWKLDFKLVNTLFQSLRYFLQSVSHFVKLIIIKLVFYIIEEESMETKGFLQSQLFANSIIKFEKLGSRLELDHFQACLSRRPPQNTPFWLNSPPNHLIHWQNPSHNS